MAGALTISTLNDSSGVLATQNGMSGIAKAWVAFNGVTTVTIAGSFNISSVTRSAAGTYTVNLTTAMPDSNYACIANGNNGTSASTTSAMMSSSTRVSSSSAYQIFVFPNDASGTLYDAANIYSAAFR